MGDLPLRTPTDRRPGGPLPRLLPNQTHPHPLATKGLCSESDAVFGEHRALIRISTGCSLLGGRLDTRYSPVRRSPSKRASSLHDAPRLACVKPVASVHPEPGSNSPLENLYLTRQTAKATTAGIPRMSTPQAGIVLSGTGHELRIIKSKSYMGPSACSPPLSN